MLHRPICALTVLVLVTSIGAATAADRTIGRSGEIILSQSKDCGGSFGLPGKCPGDFGGGGGGGGYRGGGSGATGGAVGSAVAGAAGASLANALTRRTVDDANDALSIAQRICLVGTKAKFGIDLSGKLNVSKTTPQGSLTASVDALTAEGGVIFENEEIRRLVDADIRKCMTEQWPSVFRVLKESR